MVATRVGIRMVRGIVVMAIAACIGGGTAAAAVVGSWDFSTGSLAAAGLFAKVAAGDEHGLLRGGTAG